MRLDRWLDVALEGGVTELQRGLGTYRELRTLLEGEWKTHASAVAESTARAKARCLEVDEALTRARRRVRQDASAAQVENLALRVEQERDALLARLAQLHGTTAPVAVQLDWLHSTASEEAYVESSLRRFRTERAGWTTLLLILSFAIPFAAWHRASLGGHLGTMITLEGLEEPVVWAMLGVVFLAVVACWARAVHWDWLGGHSPSRLQPAAFGIWTGAAASTLVVSLVTRSPAPFFAAALLTTLMAAVLVMRALWTSGKAVS
jgi:hypothetical protein